MTINNSNWDKVALGDIAQSLTIATKDPLSEGLERYVGLEHIEPGNIHIKSWGNVADGTTFTRVFRKGQVLFGKRRAYQKKAAMAEFDGICSGDILVCEAIKDAVVPELLPFIVQSDRFFEHAIKTSAGSLSPRTKFKDLAKFTFKLPAKPDDQKRIADLLWSVDEAIERNLTLLSKIEVLKRACENKYFSKSNGNTVKLENVVEKFISGGTPSTKNKTYWENGKIPWITTRKMEDFIVSDGERYITNLAVRETNTNIVGKGNVLFGTRVGIGKCSKADVDLAINQDVTGLVVNENQIDPEYLFYQLISGYVQSQVLCFARGTTVKGITKQDLKAIKIVLDKNRQKEIGAQFKKMWWVESRFNISITNLKDIYNGIINEIFE